MAAMTPVVVPVTLDVTVNFNQGSTMTTTLAPSTRNVFALKAVRDLIKKSPAKHDQTTWAAVNADLVKFEGGDTAKVSCGTTACVAGWASALAGDKLIVKQHNWDEDDGVFYAHLVETLDGEEAFISERARAILGLSDGEADYLFDQDRTRDEILSTLKQLIKGQRIV